MKPKPKPLKKCARGKTKVTRKVKGKRTQVCVKRRRPKKHDGKHHPEPGERAQQSR